MPTRVALLVGLLAWVQLVAVKAGRVDAALYDCPQNVTANKVAITRCLAADSITVGRLAYHTSATPDNIRTFTRSDARYLNLTQQVATALNVSSPRAERLIRCLDAQRIAVTNLRAMQSAAHRSSALSPRSSRFTIVIACDAPLRRCDEIARLANSAMIVGAGTAIYDNGAEEESYAVPTRRLRGVPDRNMYLTSVLNLQPPTDDGASSLLLRLFRYAAKKHNLALHELRIIDNVPAISASPRKKKTKRIKKHRRYKRARERKKKGRRH
ncbi:hypothetical protein CYMTET_40946 [Cymbomonas tetramitiformis]|uniref:Uncharacterized protein n=1 Tax=Cymbomonas tetramitiformis TaxID=36881 RepID=A0AAE0F2G9_9CHLO|nr:hypothetical protein CYMTET_40946 [Cymbomonas tetramitiformis]|eukprot:gene242-426_t